MCFSAFLMSIFFFFWYNALYFLVSFDSISLSPSATPSAATPGTPASAVRWSWRRRSPPAWGPRSSLRPRSTVHVRVPSCHPSRRTRRLAPVMASSKTPPERERRCHRTPKKSAPVLLGHGVPGTLPWSAPPSPLMDLGEWATPGPPYDTFCHCLRVTSPDWFVIPSWS